MSRPSYEEVVKLVEEMNVAAKAFHEMNARAKVTPFGPNERIALERLAVKASDLNKKRKAVLALFTPEERAEIKALAQQQK